MAKLKIRFLKDHDVFDEELRSFVKDEVVSLEEPSANHFVNRKLAEIVPPSTKLFKPERQIEMPIEVSQEALEFAGELRVLSDSIVSGDTKPEEVLSVFAESVPDADPDKMSLGQRLSHSVRAGLDKITGNSTDKATEDAKVITDKATDDAKVITDKATEDGKAITDKAIEDAKLIADKVTEDAKAIMDKATEDAKVITDKATEDAKPKDSK